MKRWLKRLPMIAIGIAALGLIVFAFLPQPIEADLAPVSRGPLQVTVDEDGKTRVKEPYVVSTPLAGRLLRIELDEGDPVTAGETVLAVIEPTNPALLDPREVAESEARVRSRQAALKQARAALQQARAALNQAEADFGRARGLAQRDSISQQNLELAELLYHTRSEEFRAASFAEETAQFELELAEAALLRTQPPNNESGNSGGEWSFMIRAPITGRVLRIFQESTTVLAAGERLLELGDPSDIEVEVDVLSSDAVQVQPGARALLEHWGGETALRGRVRLVEPAAFTKISALGVEEQRVNVIIDLVDPPQQRGTLGHAYRVEARIVIWEGENVLQVPTSALFRHKDQWAVFQVAGEVVRLQPVTIGHRNSISAEVLDGLREAGTVVVYPSDKVRDGVPVAQRR